MTNSIDDFNLGLFHALVEIDTSWASFIFPLKTRLPGEVEVEYGIDTSREGCWHPSIPERRDCGHDETQAWHRNHYRFSSSPVATRRMPNKQTINHTASNAIILICCRRMQFSSHSVELGVISDENRLPLSNPLVKTVSSENNQWSAEIVAVHYRLDQGSRWLSPNASIS